MLFDEPLQHGLVELISATTICENFLCPPLEIIYCASKPCDANADCQEGNLKAVCNCRSGYQGDGKSCTDIDVVIHN